MNGDSPRPFLKWVGGKARFLNHFDTLLPAVFGTYHEPFLGGGALFFHLHRRGMLRHGAVLSDANEELITCWCGVQDNPRGVIAALKRHARKHGDDPDRYYKIVRSRDWRRMSVIATAARMIYLNKAGFNGLYRVNKKGGFNVPRGDAGPEAIVDEANLYACAEALQGVTLNVADFKDSLKAARKGDLVYFDPPYVPTSDTSNFTAYTADGFGEVQHLDLAAVFVSMQRKGVFTMLSNSDVPWTREQYTEQQRNCPVDVHAVGAKRSVSADPAVRGRVSELLIRNWAGPKPKRPKRKVV